jgi:hypothetical protein
LPINRVEIEKLFSSLSPSSFVVLCLHRNAVTKNIKKKKDEKKKGLQFVAATGATEGNENTDDKQFIDPVVPDIF